jgi:surfeit locus 1 family protein
MTKGIAGRTIGALVLGLAGCAVLLALGVWQVQRLAWKEGILGEIEARIGAAPVAIPAVPDPAADRYLAVTAAGTFLSEEVHVLASRKQGGAGYRLIAAFETEDGRRVLTDRGFLPLEAKDTPRPAMPATIIGNLHWPDEVDGYTPAPDAGRGIWFARDVPAMAAALETEPVLVVISGTSEPAPPAQAFPVDTASIPNDHLGYAVTWFGLAAVWAGMTFLLVWRIRRRTT